MATQATQRQTLRHAEDTEDKKGILFAWLLHLSLQLKYRVTQKDAYPCFIRYKIHFLTNVFSVAGRDR